MKDKTPKSPLVVIASIIFLLLFIVLPPLFRIAFPKKEEIVKVQIKKSTLYCERIFISENKKVMFAVSYENNIAVKNKITFLAYTPSEGSVESDKKPKKTVEEMMHFLRDIPGTDYDENISQMVVVITDQTLIDNPMLIELGDYMLDKSSMKKSLEEEGYLCSETNN